MIWLDQRLAGGFAAGRAGMREVFAIQGEVFREPPGAGRRTVSC